MQNKTRDPMNIQPINSIDQIEIINTYAPKFDHTWKEKQSLAALYGYWSKIVIFDNHNHALYLWASYLLKTHQRLPVIHIDQHSDLATPPTWNIDTIQHTTLEDRKQIAYQIADIGSFIIPAIEWWLICSCEQIRTETKLIDYQLPALPYILDIDLDFWAPEMVNDHIVQTVQKTRDLIRNASFITIATSPGYINQKLALQILQKILKHSLCSMGD